VVANQSAKDGRPVRQHLDPALCRELLEGDGITFSGTENIRVTSAVTTWQDENSSLNAERWSVDQGTKPIGAVLTGT